MSVSRWRRGAAWLPEARARQISEALNIPLEQLVEVVERNPVVNLKRHVDEIDEIMDRAAAEPRAFLRSLMEEPPVRQLKLRRVGRRWRQVSTP